MTSTLPPLLWFPTRTRHGIPSPKPGTILHSTYLFTRLLEQVREPKAKACEIHSHQCQYRRRRKSGKKQAKKDQNPITSSLDSRELTAKKKSIQVTTPATYPVVCTRVVSFPIYAIHWLLWTRAVKISGSTRWRCATKSVAHLTIVKKVYAKSFFYYDDEKNLD